MSDWLVLSEVEVRPDREEHGDEEESEESEELSKARGPLDVHEVENNDVRLDDSDQDCDQVIDPISVLLADHVTEVDLSSSNRENHEPSESQSGFHIH
jgi:hypothetical protein